MKFSTNKGVNMAFNQTKFFDGLEQLTLKTTKDKSFNDFIYRFLELLDKPKSTITQLRSGNSRINVAKNPEAGEVALKMGVYYIPKADTKSDELSDVLTEIKSLPLITSEKIRLIFITNFDAIVLHDVAIGETIDIPFLELHKDYSFLLPFVGMKRAVKHQEHPVDIRASERVGRLINQLKKNNSFETSESIRALNTFLIRILFCFFAENAGIFEKNQLRTLIKSTTLEDGSDTSRLLSKLFSILSSEPQSELRDLAPNHLSAFPYIEGDLFKERLPVPKFNNHSRRLLINCAEMNWSDINPDIFGSMFQAVVGTSQQELLGQYYTSVENIMRVIDPLFLSDIKEELESIKSIHSKNVSRDRKWERLDELHDRISSISLIDPVCGSGNFLIVAYKELRKVEIEIIKLSLGRLKNGSDMFMPSMLDFEAIAHSNISLSNFHGIEYDEFPSQVARLSLWFAEYQMNLEFKKAFGIMPASSPLRSSGYVVYNNSLLIDWNDVCPNNGTDEIYIIGNPPFSGATTRSITQTEDMEVVFNGVDGFKSLDYAASWFWKGANYIANTKAKIALVSTKSISQGTQVSVLFPPIFDIGVDIEFAYQSFTWKNNAKHSKAVQVVIIGLASKGNITKKTLFSSVNKNPFAETVDNISPYLKKGMSTCVKKRLRPLHSASKMMCSPLSTKAHEGLFVSTEERSRLLEKEPQLNRWIKRAVGCDELINSKEKWCFYIPHATGIDIASSKTLGDIYSKNISFNNVFSTSLSADSSTVVIPIVSSERRTYLPIGFVDGDTLILNTARFIPNATLFDFAILNTRMHNDWMHQVTGRFGTGLSYSNTVVYNTFVIPEVNDEQRKLISDLAFKILMTREEYPDKTLAQMYSPNTMPENLLEAHRELDRAFEGLYKAGGFKNASERVEHLMRLYKDAIAEEKDRWGY